jgi:hypothetical protein
MSFGFVAIGVGAAGAVAGVAGSVISANAARDAAETQADAARDANATQLQMFQDTRTDLKPYRDVGYSALEQLKQLPFYHPLEVDPYTPTPVFDPTPAYTGPSEADLRTDPGYQFRVREGQKALERSAAGKGLLLSGGQLKDLTRFAQDLGAQEYGAAYARGSQKNADVYRRGYAQNADLYGRNLEAYQTTYNTLLGLRKNQFGELAGVAGAGQGAVNTLGQLGQQTGQQLAQTTIGAGNAQAAGQVGAANAWNAGLGSVAGAGNSYVNYQLLSSLLKRPGGNVAGGNVYGNYSTPETLDVYGTP